MEHIVQFAIGIDDEAIRERVIKCAYDDVVKKLLEEAKRETKLSSTNYYNKKSWSNFVDDALRGYLNENKDLVIELAATKLAESYRRTKAYREAMNKVMEE